MLSLTPLQCVITQLLHVYTASIHLITGLGDINTCDDVIWESPHIKVTL